MLEAQRPWLPQFAGKRIEPKPTIVIPPDCQPVEVPLDPALAIGKRFGTLIAGAGNALPEGALRIP